MGYDVGAPLAAGQGAIDVMVSGMRSELARANMLALITQAARIFGGGGAGALAGKRDDQSILVRQVAIYVAHTSMGMRKADCSSSLGLSKWCATRAFHTIEARRDSDVQFKHKLEQLEAVIRRWTLAARTIGPVPPTQGPIDRPVAAFAAPAGDIRQTGREVAA